MLWARWIEVEVFVKTTRDTNKSKFLSKIRRIPTIRSFCQNYDGYQQVEVFVKNTTDTNLFASLVYLEKRTCVVVLFSLGSVLLLWSPITYVKEADSYFFSPSRLTLCYMNSPQILIWALNKRTNVFTLRTPSVLFYYSFIRCGWVGFYFFFNRGLKTTDPVARCTILADFLSHFPEFFTRAFCGFFSLIVRGFYDDVRHLFSN